MVSHHTQISGGLLKAGLGFVWTNLRTHFVVTNGLVCSNSNVILMRQTCGQHSSRVAGSKRRALAFYFPDEFVMCSSYRNVENTRILVCAWVQYLQRECHCAVPTSNIETCLAAEFVGSWHYAAAFFLQVSNLCTDWDPTVLYISILKTHIKFVRENKILALGVCCPQPCSSDGRRFAASRWCSNNYQTVCSFPQERIRWSTL